jgi:anthranilate/para-aminobenzoate synthase component II
MNILVVDMGDAPAEQLQQLAAKHSLTMTLPDDIPQDLTDYAAIVVAGVYNTGLLDHSKMISMLESYEKPLVGIGSGYVVACQMLGIDLNAIAEFGDADARVVPTDDGAKLFQGTDPLLVSESQRWLAEELPKGCLVLARSEAGIEAFKHKKRPVMALQLLPHDFTYPSDAKMVYANLFSMLGK